MSQAGQNYFDVEASSWDDKPSRVRIAKAVAGAIRKTVELRSDMRALDYGCGTGLVSLEIQPHVGNLLGLDSSEGMVATFREKIQSLGLTNTEVRVMNLEEESLEPHSLDLIFSSMTFHHIPDPGPVVKKFYEALRSGGSLCIVDLVKEDGDFHDRGNEGVAHLGFEMESMEQLLNRSGFESVTTTIAHVIRKESNGKEYPLFLASGRKS